MLACSTMLDPWDRGYPG